MSDISVEQVADRAAEVTVIAALGMTYLKEFQSEAVTLSALCAALYYVTKFGPVWADNARRLWRWVCRRGR